MQFYALEDHHLISASSALRGKKYRCPQCLNPVRMRCGPHRQIHFYHTSLSRHCAQSKKGEEHLHLQFFLKNLLQEAVLEKPFLDIGRIADVAWEKEKIIFEIQCSPISLEEVKARSEDYQKRGYAVVWLLHEQRFNKKKISAAESYLRRSQCCYFTDMDKKGLGLVYDQSETLKGHLRIRKGPKVRIDLRALVARNPLSFIGDLRQRSPLPSLSRNSPSLKERITRAYNALLTLLLELVSY